MSPLRLFVLLLAVTGVLMLLGSAIGSTGWSPLVTSPWHDEAAWRIVRDIRAPRSLGAWLTGALLGLAGAVSQGLFRNPLADPYLLGSASGASLGVALALTTIGGSTAATAIGLRLGLTGAAFAGAIAAVLLTLVLARGMQHTSRLLLAGVVVGMVVGALKDLVVLFAPEIMRSMQAFMFGTTGFLGWPSAVVLAATLVVAWVGALAAGRALDALTLGEAAAASLGVQLPAARAWLIGVLSLATGAAVAQAGLIAFVGLAAPHLVRANTHVTHRWLITLSALSGGVLLLAADIASRWLLAPLELPVGMLTAVVGGGYLLWRMQRQRFTR